MSMVLTPAAATADECHRQGQEQASEGALGLPITIQSMSGKSCTVNVQSGDVGSFLASLAIERMPPSQPAIPKLLLDTDVLDLAKPLAKQGLGSGAVVTYALEAASEQHVTRLLHKVISGNQDISETDQLLWTTLGPFVWTGCPKHVPSKHPDQLDIRLFLQSELGKGGAPKHAEELDIRLLVQLEKVALPSTLQSLTFGKRFNQSLEKVVLSVGCTLSRGSF
eukprot:CAMPEP_0197638834 /NCGR_PEP_ID=MMETSP1338-20131121/13649_1 /TAXON_ID=43686 ORGANISM="Pelagodinium beii, Strain RCC1491" /NCGR_SAMPLE_ID=MMETSP1338 /ASSEMBLY_ACC=CAM_ASM_000754 /LENGTH=222 /DNA_ID=CAMNT_0043211483 /DNA_START=37 /DNA_END=706 /DNA_ORIENTATION=-